MTLAMMPYLNNKIGLHPRAAELKINNPLQVEIDSSYSGVAGAGNPTLTCTVSVTEAERATVIFPSALWLRYSTLSVIPEDDSSVFTTTTRNATTATTIISFSLLYTSHAGPYTCRVSALNADPSYSSPITLTVKLPTPTVNLSQDASGLLYEGSAVTLTCTATLPPSVDTDVNVTVQWTLAISSDRVSISPPSSSRSPFTSTLTISPLAIADTGQYYCEVTVHSSSQYIVASDPGISSLLTLMVETVEQNLNNTGKILLL
ncbi:hypothetical protein GBAR_LOCUS7955 [Geodia barretti]|uniref:Ig-like domain-containing protein n=1 Tax=Geodia barretti TaxID=519541 RepID=A0AA35RIZ7_GEOBA|nr:hypothetical protein GBAR_LOCUS7955 [Geodia barretti]